MPTLSAARDLVLAITPFNEPNADLVVAVERAGYLGVLDLGAAAAAALATAGMSQALAGRNIAAPRFPVYANSTAAPYPDAPADVRRLLAAQVVDPVRFAGQVEAMYAAGARTFVESGPGRTLTALVGRILGDRPHTAVACDAPGENGLRQFLSALAGLVNAGVPVDPGWLFASQREGVLGYLGAATLPAAALLATVPAQLSSDHERAVVPPQHPHPAAPAAGPVPAPRAAPAAPAAPLGRAEIGDAVVAVIRARTDYPTDMLGADLDLEADLSVDSVKHTEIIAALAERLGLATAGAAIGEQVMEELSRIKTITGITDWLAGHLGAGHVDAGRLGAGHGGAGPVPARRGPYSAVLARRPRRFVVEAAGLPAASSGTAPRGRFLIIEDGRGVALELADLLEQGGAEAAIAQAPADGEMTGVDGLVHLGALRPGGRPMLPDAFGRIRDALNAKVRTVLVATVGGGTFGTAGSGGRSSGGSSGRAPGGSGPGPDDEPGDLGLRGLIRTVAAEYPRVLARAVDVEPKDSPREIAAQLLAELADPAGPPVVGYRAGRRTGLRLLEAQAPPASADAGLDRDSVVLLTGGARGITAAIALTLARSAGCHIELIGRTPPAGVAGPELDTADPAALRRVLIARGFGGPREIEAEAGRLLREAQVRATLDGLRAAAASVRYHAADVRDAAAVGAVLADVYDRFGRLDGVIHGAGVLEDRLIRGKTPESFARVYETKVSGARALAAGLRGDARFLVLFGSVSGVFGNRGQSDYAAANDALDALARQWSGTRAGRVVSVDWGPWGGGGMVSPELEREYARRGITLIDSDEGVACLLAEIADPSAGAPAQVVYMCGGVPGAVAESGGASASASVSGTFGD